MGGRGGSSGLSSVQNHPEYKSEYKYEFNRAQEDVPVGSAMKSQNRDDSTVEQEMIRYRSAMGDPISAMERQMRREKRTLSDYEEAKSPANIGIRDALRKTVNEYEEAIERMKKIKKKSKYKGVM